MDKVDHEILRLLQNDASLSLNKIAELVNLSPTPCWRRIQRLESDGVIEKRVALLNPKKINLGVTVFVAIKTKHHTPAWLEKFSKTVQHIPEIVDVYRMSGDVDYLLRIVAPDISGYDLVYKKLIAGIELFDVSSSFVMEKLKSTTVLPLDYTQ